jgi:hypothetical protein
MLNFYQLLFAFKDSTYPLQVLASSFFLAVGFSLLSLTWAIANANCLITVD